MTDIHDLPKLDLKASLKKPVKWAFLAAVVTSVITLFLPNCYKSEVRLLPVDPAASGGMGGLAAAAAAFGVGIGGAGGGDANFTDILNSRWMMEHLLDQKMSFHYHIRNWYFGKNHLQTGSLYGYLEEKNMDRAVKALDEIIDAKKDLKTNVITVTVETRSPELSQQIVQRATELLNQFVVQNSRTRGKEKAAFAEARLTEARLEMSQVESSFKRFLEGNRNYQMSSDPAVRLMGTRLEAELNLRRQLVSTLALNREQCLLDAKNDVPIVNVLDAGNLPIDKSWPSRSIYVLFSMLVVAAGSWCQSQWEWVKANLLDDTVK